MRKFWEAAMFVLPVMACAAPALADNERANLFAISCLPGQACNSNTGSGGLALESFAYASAHGYDGGIVAARAGFSPSPDTLGGTFINRANADFTYTFQVRGAPGVSVPVLVHANGSLTPILVSTDLGGQLTVNPDGTASGTTGFSIQSSVSIDITGIRSVDAFGNVYTSALHRDVGNNSDNLQLAEQSILVDQILYFQTNTDISVNIFAGAALRYNGDSSPSAIYGSVSAYLDPVFSITDPAFANFGIVGVPDETPPGGGAVPEPASWAMMLAGFGLTGAALRRRTARLRFA